MILDLESCRKHILAGAAPVYRGRVDRVSGVLVEAIGVPAALGEICRLDRGSLGTVDAEVIGFRGSTTLLMPHGDLEGIAPNQPVTSLGRPFALPVGSELLGHIVDGFGALMDGSKPLALRQLRPVRSGAPDPLKRGHIDQALQTGVRVIDGLSTIGRGQRMGIFSGSGVGKSSLLAQITRGTDADVTVVALVGERGREVRAFVEQVLADRERSVVVVATSDRPPIERFLAPFVAITIAEHFRDQGLDVLMVMDSISRFAMASREIGLAAGEPPTVRGYPPSFFATVPKLLERMGRTERGSITGLLTVLLDGDDPHDPVADTLRGLLDGHVYLKRELAEGGHYPAVDVLGSLSRLMPEIASPEHTAAAQSMRESLATWRDGRDLVEIGAYQAGTNPKLDKALALMPALEAFLRQGVDETSSYAETIEMMALLQQAKESS